MHLLDILKEAAIVKFLLMDWSDRESIEEISSYECMQGTR
jgi:hypothetical protein